MKLALPTPADFHFGAAVCSHGFFVLAPNAWVPRTGTLHTVITLNDERAVNVCVRAGKGEVVVESAARVGTVERKAIKAAIARILRLEESLAGFHARCLKSDTHRPAAESRFGRLIRSASLFEDIVKVICTCNVAWRQTVAMVDAIVRHWGVPVIPLSPPLPGQSRDREGVDTEMGPPSAPLRSRLCPAGGFPTPARLAAVREADLKRLARVGYRAGFIRSLARDVADGRLDLAQIERHDGPTDGLCKLLRQIKGVGPYAAGNLAMLLGRYDCLAVDTEMVRLLKKRYPQKTWSPARMHAHYAAWRPYQFLAYWFELWQDYVATHGRAESWTPDEVGRSITPSSPPL